MANALATVRRAVAWDLDLAFGIPLGSLHHGDVSVFVGLREAKAAPVEPKAPEIKRIEPRLSLADTSLLHSALLDNLEVDIHRPGSYVLLALLLLTSA